MKENNTPTTLEQPVAVATKRRNISIGLPGGFAAGERRFPVTPEGASQLIARNFSVKMEPGAGAPIHYSDAAYARAGVELCGRTEVLGADIVITHAPLQPAEVALMHRGALLLTLYASAMHSPAYLEALHNAGITVIAADLIEHNGHRLVADILHEIDGCASLALASALLADPIHGKGILLGGVTGIVPCEVVVIGSGMGAIAAAHNALGLGATVKMFDDDLYSLRSASRVLEHRVVASAIHPHVFHSALTSADVVVVTPTSAPIAVDAEVVTRMKQRVLVFDLTATPGSTFGGIMLTDLSDPLIEELSSESGRVCYCNVGCRVARTVAMALSNCLVANIESVARACDSLAEIPAPVLGGILLLWGKCVNQSVAEAIGVRAININLMTGN